MRENEQQIWRNPLRNPREEEEDQQIALEALFLHPHIEKGMVTEKEEQEGLTEEEVEL